MKICMFPGTFSPWHEGHEDILNKALKVFDSVVIAVGINPEKLGSKTVLEYALDFQDSSVAKKHRDRVMVFAFKGLLVDAVRDFENESNLKIDAIARGLRNGHDLQYEMNQMCWNEDLGLTIPFVYFITDRTKAHISSSAIKQLIKIKGGI